MIKGNEAYLACLLLHETNAFILATPRMLVNMEFAASRTCAGSCHILHHLARGSKRLLLCWAGDPHFLFGVSQQLLDRLCLLLVRRELVSFLVGRRRTCQLGWADCTRPIPG